jgi:subfamily B ATP-binding cassette protein MsbA
LKSVLRYFQLVARSPGVTPQVVGIAFLSVVAAILEGAGIGVILPLLEVLQGHDLGTSIPSRVLARIASGLGFSLELLPLMGIGLVLFGAKSAIGYARAVWMAKTHTGYQAALQKKTFSQILNFDVGYLHRTPQGDIVNILVTEIPRASYSLEMMIEMLAAAGLVLVYGVLQLSLSWKLTVMTVVTLGPLAYFLRPRQTFQWGMEQTRLNSNLQSLAMESLAGIREIKALGLPDEVQRQFDRCAYGLAGISVRLYRHARLFSSLFQFAVVLVVLGIAYGGVRGMGLPLSSLLVYLLCLQRMAPQVQSFVDKRHWWLGSFPALEKTEKLLSETDRHKSNIANGKIGVTAISDRVEFQSVSFHHLGNPVEILDQVSFVVPRGSLVVLVGPSGAGKSTCLDLLARFYDPLRGRVLVDGVDLKDIDLDRWRSRLGVVSQDTFLFNDTVEANIRLGQPSATLEDIHWAAKKAYSHSFISALPKGYATVVGDRGVRLSGGQRQRIALARALLRKPDLLLLDEATSDLDAESEVHIHRAIREIARSCAVLMVAHRLTVIRSQDLVVVLEKGVVVESGSASSLLKSKGRFWQLYQLQAPDL